ncbi:MAG: NAD-dependent epimerase/dehydratase family protein [Acidobacteria bacterium]|nr:NAD-dependent epimerase/dehydratase family protein [Acidobacteriota bacterium]
MRIFLTGASGYIGSVAAEYLIKAGHQVMGLARSAETAGKLKSRGIEPVPGDLEEPAKLAKTAAGADAVIHTAMQWGPDSAKLDQAAVTALIGALRDSGKTLIYTSGTWVMGDTRGSVAAELAVLRPPDMVKWRPAVERMVTGAVEVGVSGIVIRPARVFGRGGGPIGEMVKQAKETGVIRFVGAGENHWCFIHVDALAELYVRAVEQAPRGELFIAADGPAFLVRTIVDTVAAMHEARVESIPLEEARRKMGPLADALVMDQRIMTTKAGRMLGWGPKWPTVLEEIRGGS